MEALQQSAFLQALGWSLADSIWQMGIAWMLYFLVVKLFSLTAEQKHNLAVLALSAGSMAFVVSLIARLAKPGTYGYLEEFLINSRIFKTSFSENIFPFISGVYLLVAAGMLIRFTWLYRNTRNLHNLSGYKAPVDLRVFAQQAAHHIGIKKKVTLTLTDGINTPITIGFFKPVILLPVSVVNHLSPEQAETILLHELFHIKRNDYLINILVNFSTIFLYFNPFAFLICQAIRTERENCCDDAVLQYRYAPQTYATALFELEKLRRENAPLLAIAATGKGYLLQRIKRILSGEDKTQVSIPGVFWGMASLLLIALFAIHAGNQVHTSRLISIPNYTIEFFNPALKKQLRENIPASPDQEIPFRQTTAAIAQSNNDENPHKLIKIALSSVSHGNGEKGQRKIEIINIERIGQGEDEGVGSFSEEYTTVTGQIILVGKPNKIEFSLAAPEEETDKITATGQIPGEIFIPKNALSFNANTLADTLPFEKFEAGVAEAIETIINKTKELSELKFFDAEEIDKRVSESIALLNEKIAGLNAQRAAIIKEAEKVYAEYKMQTLHAIKQNLQLQQQQLKEASQREVINKARTVEI